MRFLKTLQKKQVEQPQDINEVDNYISSHKHRRRRSNKPPELLNNVDLKIGKPAALYNQSDIGIDVVTSQVEAGNIEDVTLDSFASTIVSPENVHPHLVAITQPNTAYCEEYRNLRTQIFHRSQNQKLQSIVIASVGPAEGKSVTALNLAWLLAQTDGVKALVIDSDLRMPSLDSYLGIGSLVGLSEILDGKFSPQEAIVKLNPAGLYLLPGGLPRADVAELISGSKFKELLDQFRGMFDYVIIDAPPLGIFTDATVLINHADGALLVVRANKTPYKLIERVLEFLPRERMLGAVLNESEDTLISDNYYYYNYTSKNNR